MGHSLLAGIGKARRLIPATQVRQSRVFVDRPSVFYADVVMVIQVATCLHFLTKVHMIDGSYDFAAYYDLWMEPSMQLS